MLLDACLEYAKKGPQKEITFEYTLMDTVNDTVDLAHELVSLLNNKKVPAKINLIPFNPYPGTLYKRPSNNRMHRFKDILLEAGFVATIRRTRGDDIDAACGQLAGKVADKTKRQARYKQQTLAEG